MVDKDYSVVEYTDGNPGVDALGRLTARQKEGERTMGAEWHVASGVREIVAQAAKVLENAEVMAERFHADNEIYRRLKRVGQEVVRLADGDVTLPVEEGLRQLVARRKIRDKLKSNVEKLAADLAAEEKAWDEERVDYWQEMADSRLDKIQDLEKELAGCRSHQGDAEEFFEAAVDYGVKLEECRKELAAKQTELTEADKRHKAEIGRLIGDNLGLRRELRERIDAEFGDDDRDSDEYREEIARLGKMPDGEVLVVFPDAASDEDLAAIAKALNVVIICRGDDDAAALRELADNLGYEVVEKAKAAVGTNEERLLRQLADKYGYALVGNEGGNPEEAAAVERGMNAPARFAVYQEEIETLGRSRDGWRETARRHLDDVEIYKMRAHRAEKLNRSQERVISEMGRELRRLRREHPGEGDVPDAPWAEPEERGDNTRIFRVDKPADFIPENIPGDG